MEQVNIFHKACEIESILRNVSAEYQGTQGEIRLNPYEEIGKCLSFYGCKHPKGQDKINAISKDIEEVKGLTMDKIYEEKKDYILDEAIEEIKGLNANI